MTLIKDIALSYVKDEVLTELRSDPNINRLINSIAGLPTLDAGDTEKKFKINTKPNKIIYPEELEGSKEFDTFMQFDIVEYKNRKAVEETKSTQTDSGSPNADVINASGNSIKDIISNTITDITKIGSNIIGNVSANATPEKSADVMGTISADLVSTICLYQPQNLAVIYDRQWSQDELGMAEDIFKTAGSKTIDGLLAGVKGLAGRIKHKTVEKLAGAAGSATGTNIQGAAEQKLGRILNPNLALLFKAIRFRAFQFSFMFSPRNENEVVNSLAIIKVFKYWSSPDTANAVLKYPALFKIRMMKNNGLSTEENDKLFSFRPAALTNMTLDYSPNSIWATFKGGAPVSFRMDLAFTETEIITRSTIYDPKNKNMVGA